MLSPYTAVLVFRDLKYPYNNYSGTLAWSFAAAHHRDDRIVPWSSNRYATMREAVTVAAQRYRGLPLYRAFDLDVGSLVTPPNRKEIKR